MKKPISGSNGWVARQRNYYGNFKDIIGLRVFATASEDECWFWTDNDDFCIYFDQSKW